jgi:protein required for attachment to host cells
VPAATVAVVKATRNLFHADLRARIIPEINKDLTKQPVGEIERHLTAA